MLSFKRSLISYGHVAHSISAKYSPKSSIEKRNILTIHIGYRQAGFTKSLFSSVMADIQPNTVAGPQPTSTISEPLGSKRQRRPSVRLGEIGADQLYDFHPQRPYKPQLPLDQRKDLKSSKTRPLTNLTSETLDDEKEVNLESIALRSWGIKEPKKRVSNVTKKRVRSNWIARFGQANVVRDEEEVNDGIGYRDFARDNSDSPLDELSPVHSTENLAHVNNTRPLRGGDNNVDISGPSDTDDRNNNNNNNNNGSCGENGVRVWLNSLGLGRYVPVFEIHEVDHEVLPLLTLDDLKDMGISAVGSRRKIFCAIQKLEKGTSNY